MNVEIGTITPLKNHSEDLSDADTSSAYSSDQENRGGNGSADDENQANGEAKTKKHGSNGRSTKSKASNGKSKSSTYFANSIPNNEVAPIHFLHCVDVQLSSGDASVKFYDANEDTISFKQTYVGTCIRCRFDTLVYDLTRVEVIGQGLICYIKLIDYQGIVFREIQCLDPQNYILLNYHSSNLIRFDCYRKGDNDGNFKTTSVRQRSSDSVVPHKRDINGFSYYLTFYGVRHYNYKDRLAQYSILKHSETNQHHFQPFNKPYDAIFKPVASFYGHSQCQDSNYTEVLSDFQYISNTSGTFSTFCPEPVQKFTGHSNAFKVKSTIGEYYLAVTTSETESNDRPRKVLDTITDPKLGTLWYFLKISDLSREEHGQHVLVEKESGDYLGIQGEYLTLMAEGDALAFTIGSLNDGSIMLGNGKNSLKCSREGLLELSQKEQYECAMFNLVQSG